MNTTITKTAGAAGPGRRYDETFKLDAVRLLQQTGRLRAELDHVTRQRDIIEKALAIIGQDQKTTSI